MQKDILKHIWHQYPEADTDILKFSVWAPEAHHSIVIFHKFSKPGKKHEPCYSCCERFIAQIIAASGSLTWIELFDNKFNLPDHLSISFLDEASQNFFHTLDTLENIARLVFLLTSPIQADVVG